MKYDIQYLIYVFVKIGYQILYIVYYITRCILPVRMILPLE